MTPRKAKRKLLLKDEGKEVWGAVATILFSFFNYSQGNPNRDAPSAGRGLAGLSARFGAVRQGPVNVKGNLGRWLEPAGG